MSDAFAVEIEAWNHGAPIPPRFAFGRPGEGAPFAPSDNVSPAIRWSDPPSGTRSFAIVCYDPDVPSVGDDVNQPGTSVPADLPRVDFFHWLRVDIAADVRELPEGAGSNGITPRGKAVGHTSCGVAGSNDYTSWFAGDADMEGTYGDYDGPCPPWNDSIKHHYHFEVIALDVETLNLEGPFRGADVRRAIDGHVLARASHVGTYSMNPAVPA